MISEKNDGNSNENEHVDQIDEKLNTGNRQIRKCIFDKTKKTDDQNR